MITPAVLNQPCLPHATIIPLHVLLYQYYSSNKLVFRKVLLFEERIYLAEDDVAVAIAVLRGGFEL